MAKKEAAPRSFEAALQELEQILTRLERGEAGLEESLALYDRGSTLLTWCKTVLGEAELKIQRLQRPTESSPGAGADDGPEAPADATPEDEAL